MIILKAYGPYDYGAQTFEEQFDKDAVAEEMLENGEDKKVLEAKYDEKVIVELHEFNKVDPELIDFMTGFIDYDQTRHENFYIIEEAN